MSSLLNAAANIGIKAKSIDPLGYAMMDPVQRALLGKPTAGRKYYGEAPFAPPGPPTQDTAANAAQQQDDMMRKRRGVYGNIFGGAQGAAPQTSSKSQLGS